MARRQQRRGDQRCGAARVAFSSSGNTQVHADSEPVYPIGVVAKLVGVCAATLRIWERKGLIRPARKGRERYYSQADLRRLKLIHHLLHDCGANIAGVKALLEQRHCWEIVGCSEQKRSRCPVYRRFKSMLGDLP